MQQIALRFFLLGVFILSMTTTVHAEEQFQLSFERQVLISGPQSVSGLLSVYLVNGSGTDLKDATLMLPVINKVTYDNHSILIGDIGAGEGRGATIEWTVPVEMTVLAVPDLPLVWRLEYLDPAGESAAFEVVGEQLR